jgi:hypothetical protein
MSGPALRSGYVLMRHGKTLWAVADAAVRSVTRVENGYRLQLAAAELLADEVVGIVPSLKPHPISPAVRRFWAMPTAGLAVYGHEPLVLLDPEELPASLRCDPPSVEVS